MNEFLRGEAVVRRFLDNLKDCAIVLLDVDGNVADWNSGARAMKGYAAEDIIGTHFSVFYTPEARAVAHPERELAAAAATGRYEEEGWRVRKDGSLFWAHVLILAIYDDDNILRGFGKVLRDFTERKQAQEQSVNVMKLLQFTARTDYLTGLENRRSLDITLRESLSSARRQSRPLSLAMIDLDQFKNFNDEFGHQAGDIYLKRAAESWRKSLRPEDFIARYGGEEFIIVLPNTDLADATARMERLRTATRPPLTCSIGVAQWDATELPDRFIGRADQALYEAKALGRNRLAAASVGDLLDQDHLVRSGESELRRTVDCDEQAKTPLAGLDLGDVDVETADRIGFELAPVRHVRLPFPAISRDEKGGRAVPTGHRGLR